MTTQLRLVDTTEMDTRSPAPPRARRARVVKAGGSAASSARRHARAARWPGELHLDARTRKVGRAGVAAAREALERVAAEQERARAEREGRGQRAS